MSFSPAPCRIKTLNVANWINTGKARKERMSYLVIGKWVKEIDPRRTPLGTTFADLSAKEERMLGPPSILKNERSDAPST
jgi:hypothetical protein